MKNFMLLIMAVAFFSCTPKDKDAITLRLKVKNMTLSSCAFMLGPDIYTINLDKNGEATFVLEGKRYIYPLLGYGNEVKHLFLQQGDDVTITFDGTNFKNDFHFEGKNAPIVDYLNSVQVVEPPMEDYALSLEEYVANREKNIEDAVALMKIRKLNTVNPEFESIEIDRLRYTYAAAILMYPLGHAMAIGDTVSFADENYLDELTKRMVEKTELIDVEAYYSFIYDAALMLATGGKDIAEAYPRWVTILKYLGANLKNDTVRQEFIHRPIWRYVRDNGINGITEMQNIYNAYVTDPKLLAEYKEVYDIWNVTAPGRISPDFEGVDVDGKMHALKEFKGKYVYIDVWATWCGPCKSQIPYLQAIEKKLESKNIAFVSLSIDSDKVAWESSVKTGEVTGNQFLIGEDNAFKTAYNINSIPRFILLDPEGKVLNANMIRPSDKDLERLLIALPGI